MKNEEKRLRCKVSLSCRSEDTRRHNICRKITMCLKSGRSQHKTFKESNRFATRSMLQINVDSCEACSAQGPAAYSIAARSEVGCDTLKQRGSACLEQRCRRGVLRRSHRAYRRGAGIKRDVQEPGSHMIASHEKGALKPYRCNAEKHHQESEER